MHHLFVNSLFVDYECMLFCYRHIYRFCAVLTLLSLFLCFVCNSMIMIVLSA